MGPVTAFRDAFTRAGGPLDVLFSLFGDQTGVDYTHSAQGFAGLAAVTTTDLEAVRLSSGDAAGGTRAEQQPQDWVVKVADMVRAPERGDQVDDGTNVWGVVDVTHKPNVGIYRLTTQHLQTRG